MKKVLTIAGSDCSGGAGIQAADAVPEDTCGLQQNAERTGQIGSAGERPGRAEQAQSAVDAADARIRQYEDLFGAETGGIPGK